MKMEEWKECKLSDICDYGKDRIEVSSLDNSNYISTENMLPNRAGITTATTLPTGELTPSFEIDDTLVSNIRPYFKKIWKATFSGGCSADVLVFKAKENVSKEYLYYVLADDEFFKYSMTTSKGTKMPRGDKTSIMNYPVKLPPLPTQQKIAAILSSLDDKIELNNKINTNLEQQAQALFKNWFVDFEPFGGKMPEGWKVGKLSEIGTIVGGSTPSKAKKDYYTNNGIAWITPKDLSNDKSKFISHGETDITELGFENSSAIKMPKGTVLYSSRAPIGYIAIAKNEVTTNQGFKSVIPDPNVGNAYIYYFLKSNFELIDNMASGSTFKEISGTAMKNVPVLIPDDKTLYNFQTMSETLFSQQELLENENRNLSAIRNTLLPKLINGEIEV